MTNFGISLRANTTPIPGLTVWDLPVHGDNRGWFKENWQREKMCAAGLPDFGPVQQNLSFNDAVGTTRGIHAEPWDKFVSVAAGRVFGAWVDLRDTPSFGTVFTAELNPSKAVFVPRGVGNAFQTLEPNSVYTYLVNDHYAPERTYSSVNLADPTLAIPWPISLEHAELSAKDRAHPLLTDVSPMQRRKALVVGAKGQVGRALMEVGLGGTPIEYARREDFDISSRDVRFARHWRDFELIINAAAYTDVDATETPAGRVRAWSTNVTGAANLASIAAGNGLTLIHVSSDYVFDGSAESPYREDAPVCPISVYGQTKAAADRIVQIVPRHYILRTSWVIGEGRNFVKTMLSLADRGVDPKVVNDQYGRLTFASDLARAVQHLIRTGAPYGTYNITGSGPAMSWADIARHVFRAAGHNPARVTGIGTNEYTASKNSIVAPRPRYSVLDLSKIAGTGFSLTNHMDGLNAYVEKQLAITNTTI